MHSKDSSADLRRQRLIWRETVIRDGEGKKIKDRLALIGVDTLKNIIFDRLQRGRGIRFSRSLEPVYCEQLASERRVVRYPRGQPVPRFERVSSRTRAEALDALVYATAARSTVPTSFERREAEIRMQEPPKRSIASMLAR